MVETEQTKYKLRDLQFAYRYFGGGNGEIFNSKKEVQGQLISYHSSDCNEESLKRMSFNELLEFGEWELEEVKE